MFPSVLCKFFGMTKKLIHSCCLELGRGRLPAFLVCALGDLLYIIDLIVSKGLWKLIKLGKMGHTFFIRFFANHMFLFGEASISHIEVIKKCNNIFTPTFRKKKWIMKSLRCIPLELLIVIKV